MALATKTPSFLNQIDTVIENTEKTKESKKEVEVKETKKTSKPKKDNSDVLMLRLPKGERQAFKTFCASKGTDMTNFIYSCMDFVRYGTEEGFIQVGKGGVRLIEQK